MTQIDSFHIIGIEVRTSNVNRQSASDIGVLWGKFFSEQTANQIPNVISPDIHCIYTNYEGDHMKPYTVLLGHKVDSLDHIPDGLTGMTFSGGDYMKYSFSGSVAEGMVYKAWEDIWQKPLDRSYSADFEIYSAKSTDPENQEVDIFVGIKAV